MANIKDLLKIGAVVTNVLLDQAANSDTKMTPSDVKKIEPAVTKAVEKELSPIIKQLTNQEPWYQSRITLAQYVTLIATIAGLFGYTLAPEYQEQIIAAVLAVGALVNPLFTLWARWFPNKPLGE